MLAFGRTLIHIVEAECMMNISWVVAVGQRTLNHDPRDPSKITTHSTREHVTHRAVACSPLNKGQIPLRYPGRRQVRGWSQTCRRPPSSCPDGPNSSSLQVCDQLRTRLRPARTCLRPDSVMEVGLDQYTDLEGDVSVVVHSEYFWFVDERQSVDELTKLRQRVVRRRVIDPCTNTK